MEGLWVQQQHTMSLIMRSLSNLRRVGQSKLTKGLIQARASQLDSHWKKFQDRHAEILALPPNETQDHLYFMESYFDTTEESYLDARGEMLDMLEQLTPSTSNTNTQRIETPLSVTSELTHLPRINVPRFSGNYKEWANFRDLFTTLIHSNASLTEVQKMHYLKGSLAGEAEQLLRNITVSAVNYTTAWDRLVHRYDNERVLVQAHIGSLVDLPKVTADNAQELRRLVNTVTESLDALTNLGRPVHTTEDLLVYLVVKQLDATSRHYWEMSLGASTKAPSMQLLQDFLEGRIRAHEVLASTITKSSQRNTDRGKATTRCQSHVVSTREQLCAACSGKHFILYCPTFKGKTATQRREIVITKRLCYNCLSASHGVNTCRLNKNCQNCNGRHHTLLHGAEAQQASASGQSVVSNPASASDNDQGGSVTAHVSRPNSLKLAPVLLATACVVLEAEQGRRMHVRALLDQGSETSFVSERISQQLQLSRKPAFITVLGIGGSRSITARGHVVVQLHSRVDPDFRLEVQALVIPQLTAYLLEARSNITEWSHIQGLQLADPHFGQPARIDIILGAKEYSRVLQPGIRKGSVDTPIAQNTTLGWVLSGPAARDGHQSSGDTPATVHSLQCTSNTEVQHMLQRFWEQEEVVTSQPLLTEEDLACEDHYNQTHRRDNQGRYIVRLPIKGDVPKTLCLSRTGAIQMLERMERRFSKDAIFAKGYANFMTEYNDLGHMTAIPTDNLGSTYYYLPRHAVLKETSTTTRLRVVFNASYAPLNAPSLNQLLHTGSKLQAELSDIILRW